MGSQPDHTVAVAFVTGGLLLLTGILAPIVTAIVKRIVGSPDEPADGDHSDDGNGVSLRNAVLAAGAAEERAMIAEQRLNFTLREMESIRRDLARCEAREDLRREVKG